MVADMSALADALTATGFGRLVQLEVVELSADRTTVRIPVTERLMQPHGIVHGGVHAALVETAASAAATAWWGERGPVVGVSNQTDFLRPARDGHLDATATPLHRGRLQQLWEVHVTDATGRLVARGQVRLQNLGPDHL